VETLCPNVPTNRRSAGGPVSMDFGRAHGHPMAEPYCNDVGSKDDIVSPSRW
jgi:hypothetical protein